MDAVTIPDPVTLPTATRKSRRGERWLNASVVMGAILVYLSLYLESATTFVVGQAFCRQRRVNHRLAPSR